ncbi:GGDEF domain-containing protein [Methylococcus sp. EFPC2]|uniref:GGDEF domain-containing protein n=1 Tax=Methylococcus sp. EFPC2 TaxID=2812648 RepID=UPI001967CB7C|nr:GGDEF domain-containing protein [Methylococcus sp. EFPC2]QSA98663.1 diguanylate cyclase [Methylococcus sp. EFPC2]
MNSPIDEPESYWREKYLRLLNSGEAYQLDQEQREQLLSKAVIRLTYAASGFDPALDPHLLALREVMRKELKTSDLRQQLDALMDAMIRVPPSDHSDAARATGLELLRFLKSPQLAYRDEKALDVLQERIESNTFGTEDQLFAAVAKRLNERPGEESRGWMGRLLGGHIDSSADESKLRGPLEGLLKAVSAPASLEKRKIQLIERVSHGDANLIGLLDSSAALITEIGAELSKEHQALHEFLSALSAKLGQLEEKTFELQAQNQESAEIRRTQGEAVGEEVAGLRSAARDETDLLKLKDIVETRLDFVATQLEAHKSEEEARFAASQKQLRDVSLRLVLLEQESDDLRTRLSQAHDIAYTDALTRLPNRAAYQERIELEEKRWRRFRQPISLVIWDIDRFKQINDRFGHASGDKALSFISRILISSVRSTDFVARYGGEEFIMLLVGSDENDAMDVAEEMRKRIEECEFTTHGKRVSITISCGMSQFKGQDRYEDVFERADQALYQAKRKGRNRCELAPVNR